MHYLFYSLLLYIFSAAAHYNNNYNLSAPQYQSIWLRIVVDLYITHIYSGERDKCSALVTRNNKIRLLESNNNDKTAGVRDL